MKYALILIAALGCRTTTPDSGGSSPSQDEERMGEARGFVPANVYKLPVVAWQDLDLNREGRLIDSSQLTAQHKIAAPLRGFLWSDEDHATEKWYPQGLTGVEGNGKHFLIVSWYGKNGYDDRGVRLSFVDFAGAQPRYRHVILVETKGDKMKPITIHAGGLAVIDDYLYVADTMRGFRVFNLRQIFEVTGDGDHFGEKDGKFSAFGYRYVLNQVAMISAVGSIFSFVATDWTDPSSPQLISGNYKTRSSKTPEKRVLKSWTVNENFEMKKSWESWDDYNVEIPYLTQGAAKLGNKLFFATSGGNAKLMTGKLQKGDFAIKEHPWPHGLEDLYITKDGKELWCHTEHPRTRLVFAVDPAAY